MTRKLAIFVEGLTEQIFSKKLVQEIGGRKNITIGEGKYRGNRLIDLFFSKNEDGEEAKYLVLIVDCGNDEQVKSAILDQRDALIGAGYEKIVGLRDLYPNDREDYNRVEMGLRTRVPTRDIPIDIVLAIMEIEAWFLQEWNHYNKIDPRLSSEFISENLNFHPENDNAEDVERPADLLHRIYQLANKSYKKDKRKIERTIYALDYDNMYISIRSMLPQFERFVAHIDSFV